MSDTRFLLEVTPRGILSFGPDTEPIQLSALNVLIGANGSGKSNLIDVIGLIRATANNLEGELIENGGVDEWAWKGDKNRSFFLEVTGGGVVQWNHRITFLRQHFFTVIASEDVSEFLPIPTEFWQTYKRKAGNVQIELKNGNEFETEEITLSGQSLSNSIVAEIKLPSRYTLLSVVSHSYQRIRIYREWSFGRKNLLRTPKPTDSRNDFLAEDYSNLGLVLSRSGRNPEFKNAILEGLRGLYQGLTGFEVVVEGGTTQIFVTEGKFTIPATRLSDGTLRYLCLLAILCDPKPAPLICIEEPELGLHPDILPGLAQLLLSAATRTQLIVTTHSEILIDALTDHPESVLVCEKTDGQTQIKRLETDDLKVWLEEYRLGQLWMRGQIGGTRW